MNHSYSFQPSVYPLDNEKIVGIAEFFDNKDTKNLFALRIAQALELATHFFK